MSLDIGGSQCPASHSSAYTLERQQFYYDFCQVHLSAFYECRIGLMAVEEECKASGAVAVARLPQYRPFYAYWL